MVRLQLVLLDLASVDDLCGATGLSRIGIYLVLRKFVDDGHAQSHRLYLTQGRSRRWVRAFRWGQPELF